MRQIGLHAQTGQGCFELVRCVGQKAFLRDDGVFQALQQVVDRNHQRGYLHGHGFVVEWAQVVRLARANALFELRQGLDAPHQSQPHQQHRQWQQGELGQHHALDDLGGQHGAFFTGLGHLHQCRWRVVCVQPDPGVGHPHFQAAHFIVADMHFVAAALGRIGFGQGQVALAAQVLVQAARDLVIHQVGLVGAQQFTGRQRQAEFHPVVWPQTHLLGQGLDVVNQGPVKGFVGQALRHQPGQRQADGPQQKQWREHPVQDFPKQRALFAFEDPHVSALGFHGLRPGWQAVGTGSAGDFFEAITQAAHGGDADRAFFDFLAQTVDVHLDRVVAHLFAPFA